MPHGLTAASSAHAWLLRLSGEARPIRGPAQSAPYKAPMLHAERSTIWLALLEQEICKLEAELDRHPCRS